MTAPAPRCYTVKDLMPMLHLGRTAFYAALREGRLPFLEELRPRAGRKMRFRADLVDRYMAGDWTPAAPKPALVQSGRHYFSGVGAR